MQIFLWHNPSAFLFLGIIPIVYVLELRYFRKPSLVFSSLKQIQCLIKNPINRALWILNILKYACIFFVILALARPQLKKPLGSIPTQGIDIMLCIDISSSMLALDFSQGGKVLTRAQAVIAVLKEFIQRRPNDRIGLIVFAGSPYLVSPLTMNHPWLIQNLDRVHVGLVEDGTAIGSAIAMSLKRLEEAKTADQKFKPIVILLTDGVNNKGKITPKLATQMAEALGVKIYTIGVGQGGVVPTLLLDKKGSIMHNTWGQPNIVQAEIPVDEETLEYIAQSTKGFFFRAKDKTQLEAIYKQIDTIEKHSIDLNITSSCEELFMVPLGIGIVFLMIYWLLSQTRFQYIP